MTVFIGFIIGSVLGLTGAGGSIFAVPLLILLAGFAPTDAMGIALGAVMVSAVLGAVAQRNIVLWQPALVLALGGVIAAPAGKYASLILDDVFLIAGFVMIALLIAAKMLVQALQHPEFSTHVRGTMPKGQKTGILTCRLSPTGQFQLRPRCISGLTIGGLCIGFASGLFGVGGGFLIVPLLLFLSALSIQKAIATSLAVISLISASGFVSHIVLGSMIDLKLAANVLIGAIVGMLFSQRFSRHLAGPTLQLVFSILLIIVAMMLSINYILK